MSYKKKDCKNKEHKEVGVRLRDSEIVCLECKHEQTLNIMKERGLL